MVRVVNICFLAPPWTPILAHFEIYLCVSFPRKNAKKRWCGPGKEAQIWKGPFFGNNSLVDVLSCEHDRIYPYPFGSPYLKPQTQTTPICVSSYEEKPYLRGGSNYGLRPRGLNLGLPKGGSRSSCQVSVISTLTVKRVPPILATLSQLLSQILANFPPIFVKFKLIFAFVKLIGVKDEHSTKIANKPSQKCRIMSKRAFLIIDKFKAEEFTLRDHSFVTWSYSHL